ncbi:MAG: hypothetical protein JO000_10890 [Alphaproteobacteria bacterium]|nr:hypothetical protein [Alphaproteobacteria bacterium]
MRCVVVVAVAALCLAACATAPVEETKAFVAAVNAVKSSSDLLFDELNVAERNSYRRRLTATKTGAVRFQIGDAYYFSSIAEAPDTADFRRALSIIHDYSELLRMLVEGTNVEAARGQIETLIAKVATLAGNPAISAAAGDLSGLLDQLLLVISLEEAKRLVVTGEPAIHQLVAALRAATPAIFKTLRDDILAAGGGVSKKVDAERVVVANFVVMLDRLDQTFAQLVRAFEHPTNPVTLAALVALSTQLEADVKSVRQAYLAFRKG